MVGCGIFFSSANFVFCFIFDILLSFFSGFLCEHGLHVGGDLEEYCRLLVTTLKLILQSDSGMNGIDVACCCSENCCYLLDPDLGRM